MVEHASAVFVALVLLFLMDSSHSSPINSAGVTGKEMTDVMNYMMNYGYLKRKDPGEIRTKDELDKGIRQMQEFSGMNVTGKIDEETVKMTKKPRCSLPDIGPSDMMRRRKRYALHYTGWNKLNLTYRILNISTLELTKHQVNVAMRKAFDMWSDVSPLTFEEIFVGEADIMISFVARSHADDYPFNGRGGVIAHAFFPWNNTGEDGDIHFDDDEHWTLNNEKVGINFLWAAIHEVGHAIGVDHSWNRKSVMVPEYPGYQADVKLDDDDIMAIQAKYGTKAPVPTKPPTPNLPIPFNGSSPCETTFDAVVHSRDGNTYFFKRTYFWTLDKHKRLLERREIVDHWEGLEPRVQAGYTRLDGKTVFFKGRRYWVYEGTKRIEGPEFITDFGLPVGLKRLDAAFTWSANGKTYFFKGNKYWRYSEELKKLDRGYPKNISQHWGAVPYPVSAAMSMNDGVAYFFKGLNYSKYEFSKLHLYKPKKISEFFFKCGEGPDDNKNGILKTTVFAPVIALMAFVASLHNLLPA